ncbi:MAG: cytochrome c [Deltaproteobacteria bacterium]|nr:cytochrome c [Deltaproteobacteria bacterium]
MVTLWTKSVLSLPLVGLAVVNLIVMLELSGRAERRFSPGSLRLIHRISGGAYIVLFLLLSYFCLRVMRVSGQELSARAALHGGLAVATLLLLCLKLAVVRFYRKYYSMATSFGFAVVVLTVLTWASSGGYYFTMRGTSPPLPGGGRGEGLALDGAVVFGGSCSGCHFADRTDTRIGPGLKGLFGLERLPTSGWPVTEENVLRQLKTPFRDMPPFAQLSKEDVEALLAFLRSL